MAKVNKSKEMQGFEANYAAAWRVLRDVARRDARMVAVVALVPGLAILPLFGAPAGSEFALVAGLVYLGAVAVAPSWYRRACLAVLHSGAPGAAVLRAIMRASAFGKHRGGVGFDVIGQAQARPVLSGGLLFKQREASSPAHAELLICGALDYGVGNLATRYVGFT